MPVAMGTPWLYASILLFTGMMYGSLCEVPPKKHNVTYGSLIQLEHVSTGYRLHSHDKFHYAGGSRQQSVTCFPHVNSANSYWMVKPEFGSSAQNGDTIQEGSIVRLQHGGTKKWLHSHNFDSPLSQNLEVSAFGGPDESDTGDHWRLVFKEDGDVWTQDQKVRLYHNETSRYLHSREKNRFSGAVAGEQLQEVCGFKKKTLNNVWIAAEGVYLTRSMN